MLTASVPRTRSTMSHSGLCNCYALHKVKANALLPSPFGSRSTHVIIEFEPCSGQENMATCARYMIYCYNYRIKEVLFPCLIELWSLELEWSALLGSMCLQRGRH